MCDSSKKVCGIRIGRGPERLEVERSGKEKRRELKEIEGFFLNNIKGYTVKQ